MRKTLLLTCGITFSVVSAFAQQYIQSEASSSFQQFAEQGNVNINIPATDIEVEIPDPSVEELQALQRIDLIKAINKQNKGKTQNVLDSVEVYFVNSAVDSAWQYKWFYKYNSSAQVIEKGRKNDLGYFLERWLYQYDDNENIISEIYQSCNNNVWYNSSKIDRTYNSWGKVTLNSYMTWSSQLDQWVGIYKYIYDYSSLGQQIFYERYNWSSTYNNWNGVEKYERTFHGSTGYVTYNLSYAWNTETQSWNISSKYSYQYNSANLQTYYDTYIWDNAMNDWKGVQKIIREYNYNNLNTNYYRYVWDSNIWGWANDYMSNLFYDYNNWWIGTNGYYWNATTSNWEFRSRALVSYDGLEQTRIWETRTSEADPWVNSSKLISEFDSQRRLLFQEVWNWDLTNEVWVSSNKTYWSYNLSGMQTFYDTYSWDIAQSDWVRRRTYSRTYNDQNLQLSNEDFQWDAGGVLTFKSRYEYGYNIDGVRISTVNYYGPAGDTTWLEKRTQEYIPITNIILIDKREIRVTIDSDWVTQHLYIYEFDIYGNRTLMIQFALWNTETNTWSSGYKEETTISPDGSQFIYTKGVYWNNTYGNWDDYGYQSKIYYYSPNNPTSDNTIEPITGNVLQLYPNPASGGLNIKTEKPSMVEVFSPTGQLVARFNCESSHLLNISSYPLGVYIVRVGSNSERFIKR